MQSNRVSAPAPAELPPLMADDDNDGAFTPPPLDVSKYHRTVIPAQLGGKAKENPTDIPVFYDKSTNEPAYVSNLHAMIDLCDGKPSTVKSGLHAFLNKKQNIHFKREMKTVQSAFYSPPHVIIAMSKLFNCEDTNPEKYIAKGDDAGVAANTVRSCREAFAARVPLGLALARPNQRVEEISSLAGAAPTGITGVAVDNDADDTAVVKFQREQQQQQQLVVRRLNAEITEREANANAQKAKAEEREKAKEYTQLQITYAQQHQPLIQSRLSSEARKADAEARKADAEANKADAETQAAQQAVERARAEQQQKEADAAHARKLDLEKLKRDTEQAAAAVEDKCRKRVYELKTLISAAPTMVAVVAERSELADLFVQIKMYATLAIARGQATKVWKDAHPSAAPPQKRQRTDSPEPVPVAEPAQAAPVNPQRTVYVRVGVNCPQQYVGLTKNHDRRTREHDGGAAAGGAAVVERFNLCNEVAPITPAREDIESWETKETCLRMTMYGVDNVFGGKFAMPFRSADMRRLAILDCFQHLNLCNRCGRNTHKVTHCHEQTYADWTGGGVITRALNA